MTTNATPARTHPDEVIVVGSVQPTVQDWSDRAAASSAAPHAVDSVTVAAPAALAALLPADPQGDTPQLTLSSDQAEMRDNLYLCFSVGGWAALRDAYNKLNAKTFYQNPGFTLLASDLLDLASTVVHAMVDEVMPVMAQVEAAARAEIGAILKASMAALVADTPQLLAGATLEKVKNASRWSRWQLADTPLVQALFDALRAARSEIAELKDAQSSKGYIDSLREVTSDVKEHAAQRLADAQLKLTKKLRPVADSHPLVHWLLGLEPDQRDPDNADRIAAIIGRIADAIDTVAEEADRTTAWPTSTDALFAPFKGIPLGDSPFAAAVGSNPTGPWSYPLVIERVLQRMHIQPPDVRYVAAQEVLHGRAEDSALAVSLSIGVAALDFAFPTAGVVANLLLAAWPLWADWHKYATAEAGAWASVDGATPIAMPSELHQLFVDAVQLLGTAIPGWKGLALNGAAVVMSISSGS